MVDLDAIQNCFDAANVTPSTHASDEALLALARVAMPALIAELRKARDLLPHHCGDGRCGRRVEPDSVLCDCPCDECSIAESMGIYAHEATP